MPVKTYEMYCFTCYGDLTEAWAFILHLGSQHSKGFNTHNADGMLKVSIRNHVSYIACQAEICPTTERKHLQGFIQFKSGINFTSATELFKVNGRQHHIAVCKGDDNHNEEYCTSEMWEGKVKRMPLADCTDLGPLWVKGQPYRYGERRSIAGIVDKGQGSRADLQDVYDAIQEGKSWAELLEDHFVALSKCHVVAKQLYDHVLTKKTNDIYKRQMESAVLRPWQHKVSTHILTSQPDPRAVYYIWDEVGNMGKTFLASYLDSMKSALVLQAGKKADIAYIIKGKYTTMTTVIFDLTRSSESGSVNVVFEVCEALKGGNLMSTKYESLCLRVQPMHVIIFSNYAPQLRDANAKLTLSCDRWKVCKLTPGCPMTDPDKPIEECWMTMKDKESLDVSF